MSDEDGAVPRWCIKDDRAFLLRCSLHAPVLGGVILVLGICATTYVSDLGVYGIAQLPVALTFVPIASVLGAIFGIVVGAVPGMLGGAALLFLSHFRAPTTFEFLAVAPLSELCSDCSSSLLLANMRPHISR